MIYTFPIDTKFFRALKEGNTKVIVTNEPEAKKVSRWDLIGVNETKNDNGIDVYTGYCSVYKVENVIEPREVFNNGWRIFEVVSDFEVK